MKSSHPKTYLPLYIHHTAGLEAPQTRGVPEGFQASRLVVPAAALHVHPASAHVAHAQCTQLASHRPCAGHSDI